MVLDDQKKPVTVLEGNGEGRVGITASITALTWRKDGLSSVEDCKCLF